MQKIFKVSALTLAMSLAACGGGGGSPGTTEESYSITLRADKTQLPINVAGVSAGIGVYAPYSTVLYVDASVGGRPIPGSGGDTFGCNVAGGLDSGSLYYIDGKSEHEVDVDDGNGGTIKVPGSYRSITLGSNSGGNSFHFHTGNKAGTARITCTVTDPRDQQQKSAYVDINVGSATKKPASVRVESVIPGYLGTKNNVADLKNQMAMVAFIMDDANQPVASASAPNLQVSIRSDASTASGARLLSGNQSGSVLQLNTGSTGTAQYSLRSGDEAGLVVLEFTADRYDNNVQNGIQDPISVLSQVYVVEDSTTRPAVIPPSLGEITNGVPFFYMLETQGGLPPYTWVITGLPAGLTANSSGVISGTPKAPQGTYRAKATVTDKNKITASTDIALTLVGDHESINPDNFVINGCSANASINTACVLPSATAKNAYTYAFTASVSGVTWEFSGLPGWLKAGTTGTTGYINGIPDDDCGTSNKYTFLVTAKKGVMSVTRQASITVNAEVCPTEPPTIPALNVVPSSLSLSPNTVMSALITGGSGQFQVFSSDTAIATVVVNGSKLSVTGVNPGSVSITVLDTVTLKQTILSVNVTGSAGLDIVPSSLIVPVGTERTASIVGGSGKFQAISSDTTAVTVTVNGSELSINSFAQSSYTPVTITVIDLVTLKQTRLTVLQ